MTENTFNLNSLITFKNLIDNYPRFNIDENYIVLQNHFNYLTLQNNLRKEPNDFQSFHDMYDPDEVLDKIQAEGGVVFMFHSGAYRNLPRFISEQVSSEMNIKMIVDQESYDSEQELNKWNKIKDELRVDYIIAENNNSGLQIMRHLKKKGLLFIYIDGNTGSGQDSNPTSIPFLNKNISVRSGIYRMIHKLGVNAYVAVSSLNNDKDVVYFEEINVTDDIEKSIKESYSIFEREVDKFPHIWRFWYRHHLSYTDERYFEPISFENKHLLSEDNKYILNHVDNEIYENE